MKLAILAAAVFVLGIVVGMILAGGPPRGQVSAEPKCPGPSARCTPTPTATATATPTPAALHTYTVSDSLVGQVVTAMCDEGDEVSGGGFSASTASFPIQKSEPVTNPTDGWRVVWDVNSGITAFAVCIDNPPLRSSP